MAKIPDLNKRWARPLPVDDFLEIAQCMERWLTYKDTGTVFQASIANGTKVEADTLSELCSDLAGERESTIEKIVVAIRCRQEVFALLECDSAIRLHMSGRDENTVHGVFGRLERAINQRFDDLNHRVEEASDNVLNPTVTIHQVSMSGGSLAVAGSGPATASQSPAPTSEPSQTSWWRATWITLVVPILVAVIAGIVLALMLGH